ncbi:hypothetical protein C8R45DRAFT_1013984 [Mycena sanguinolenta]|nr:hypothetical protein C8R45DRAFT_1013984 [Mycena sanguinolenta]
MSDGSEPIQLNDSQNDSQPTSSQATTQLSTVVPSTPAPPSGKRRADVPASVLAGPSTKKARTENVLAASLDRFGTEFEAPTSGLTSVLQASNSHSSPDRRSRALGVMQEKETWLSFDQQLTLGEILERKEKADLYLAWRSSPLR